MKRSIFFKSGSLHHNVEIDDIDWIQSEGNYCNIQSLDRRFVIKMSLVTIMKELRASTFIKVHKSYIVNINQIEKLDLPNNIVYIKDMKIPIGRTYRTQFLENLNIL